MAKELAEEAIALDSRVCLGIPFALGRAHHE